MNVVVFLADGFEEVEALTPVDYLRRVGVNVITASCGEALNVTGSHKITVVADALVADITSDVYSGNIPDAVIIPGGMPGASNVAECENAVKVINEVYKAGGITAAICAAPVVVFAKLGLLSGKKYTCYPTMEQQLEKWCGSEWLKLTKDAVFTGERCVLDGKLITAAGPGTAEEFAIQLVRSLVGEDAAGKLISGGVMRSK